MAGGVLVLSNINYGKREKPVNLLSIYSVRGPPVASAGSLRITDFLGKFRLFVIKTSKMKVYLKPSLIFAFVWVEKYI